MKAMAYGAAERFSLLREADGQAVVDYSLIVLLVTVVAVAVLGFIGGDVDWMLEQIESQFNGDQ